MEGHLYWQQLECCCVHVETRVQGATESQVILCEDYMRDSLLLDNTHTSSFLQPTHS